MFNIQNVAVPVGGTSKNIDPKNLTHKIGIAAIKNGFRSKFFDLKVVLGCDILLQAFLKSSSTFQTTKKSYYSSRNCRRKIFVVCWIDSRKFDVISTILQ